MKKVKIIGGICWAILCLILILILFPGLNSFSASVSKFQFMKINPLFTGGEVANQIITDSCTLNIRKPVFNGLFSDRQSGFVQLDWHGKIPEIIMDTIDYDGDGKKDFCILIDRKVSKTELDPVNKKVKSVIVSTPTSYGWAVRVQINK